VLKNGGLHRVMRAEKCHHLRSSAVAASALCFLAGYPSSFAAFAIATFVYAAARSWRYGLATLVAVAASLGVAAVQLLRHSIRSTALAYTIRFSISTSWSRIGLACSLSGVNYFFGLTTTISPAVLPHEKMLPNL
jgi:hypothetical protein